MENELKQQAREIVADYWIGRGKKDYAEKILRGECDETGQNGMEIAMAALSAAPPFAADAVEQCAKIAEKYQQAAKIAKEICDAAGQNTAYLRGQIVGSGIIADAIRALPTTDNAALVEAAIGLNNEIDAFWNADPSMKYVDGRMSEPQIQLIVNAQSNLQAALKKGGHDA